MTTPAKDPLAAAVDFCALASASKWPGSSVLGIEPMRGDASVSVVPEKEPTRGVIMSVTKAPGLDGHGERAGVEVVPLLDRKSVV